MDEQLKNDLINIIEETDPFNIKEKELEYISQLILSFPEPEKHEFQDFYQKTRDLLEETKRHYKENRTNVVSALLEEIEKNLTTIKFYNLGLTAIKEQGIDISKIPTATRAEELKKIGEQVFYMGKEEIKLQRANKELEKLVEFFK